VKSGRRGLETGLRGVPPYIAYKTFATFMDQLQRGNPSRIDRSLMASLSGSNQSHLLAALRYLGLISSTGGRTDRLDALLKSHTADQAKVLRKILVASYPFLSNGFDVQRATLQELEDKLSEAGASGDTLRKCVAFFLGATKAADIVTSPFLTEGRRRRRSPRPAVERNRGITGIERSARSQSEQIENPNIGDCAELLVAKFPQFDPAWPNELKVTWFEAFQRLMDKIGR
jgi:hypothetical protein